MVCFRYSYDMPLVFDIEVDISSFSFGICEGTNQHLHTSIDLTKQPTLTYNI